MFDPKRPEDLRAMLLHMAAAGAATPESRIRVSRWLRAAQALVDDGEPDQAPVRVTPAMSKALEELAFSLQLAAEHAEYLAESAGLTGRLPRP